MHPEVAELIAVLEEMATLLRQHNFGGWAITVDRCRLLIATSQLFGVKRLLGLYRGKASLNDIVLMKARGVLAEANDRLEWLRSRSKELAQQILHVRRLP